MLLSVQKTLSKGDWVTEFICLLRFTFIMALCPALSSLWSHLSVRLLRRTGKYPENKMPQVAWGHELYVPWVSDFNNEATVLPGEARMWISASWMQVPSSKSKGLQVGQKKAEEECLRMQLVMRSGWAPQRLGFPPAPSIPDTQKRKQLAWDSQCEQ